MSQVDQEKIEKMIEVMNIEELKNDNRMRLKQIAALKNTLKIFEAKDELYRKKIYRQQKNYDQVKNEIEELKSQKYNHNISSQQNARKIRNFEERIQMLQSQLMKKYNDPLSSEKLKQLEGVIKDIKLKSENQEKKKENLQKKCEKYQIEESNEQMKEHEKNKDKLQNESNQMHNIINSLEQENKQIKQKCEQKQKYIVRLIQENDVLRKNNEQIVKINPFKNKIFNEIERKYLNDIQELNRQVTVIENRAIKQQNELKQKNQKYEILLKEKQQLSKQANTKINQLALHYKNNYKKSKQQIDESSGKLIEEELVKIVQNRKAIFQDLQKQNKISQTSLSQIMSCLQLYQMNLTPFKDKIQFLNTLSAFTQIKMNQIQSQISQKL